MPETDVANPPASGRAEHPALQAYRARTARAMRIYAGVLVAVMVLAFVAVKLAYAHGELSKVSASTGAAPAQIPPQATAGTLSLAWHSSDRPAGGNPYAEGVVITYDQHTVNGRDALTGSVRWHYTRSDETICSVLQQDSSTIAIYERKGSCDEVTGFVTATGVTKWYRTLMDDGRTATASTANVVLTVADHSVHDFDNAGGLDRWNWTAPDGCAVTRALAGSLGVLIGLDCGGQHRLVLRDLFKDSDKWTVTTPVALLPIAASAFVGALDPASGAVHSYTADKGADSVTGQLPDVAAAAAQLPRAASTVTGLDAAGQSAEFVRVGRLFSLSHQGVVRWSSPATSDPWLVGDTLVAATEASGQVVLHRMDTGAAQLTSTLTPAPAAGSRPYPIGAGLLMAGDGTACYR
ncbi:MAG: hypothetical protein ACR2N4_06365 [Jatrophihabitans sp.]